MDYMNYPDYMNMDRLVEEYLEQYYAMNGYQEDFPSDEELEMMYGDLYQRMMQQNPQYADMQEVSTQQFGGLLWLALIAALYRRYPYYRRRCRYGYERGCRGRRGPGYGPYGPRRGRGYPGYY